MVWEEDRQRLWLDEKFSVDGQRSGEFGCLGCGRCPVPNSLQYAVIDASAEVDDPASINQQTIATSSPAGTARR